MIETSSNPGDLVVDMFAGSGSTGVAAAKLGRQCVLIERSDCPMRIESTDLPSDYEACGDCGFDHGYEQEEAARAHAPTHPIGKDPQ